MGPSGGRTPYGAKVSRLGTNYSKWSIRVESGSAQTCQLNWREDSSKEMRDESRQKAERQSLRPSAISPRSRTKKPARYESASTFQTKMDVSNRTSSWRCRSPSRAHRHLPFRHPR